jgi:cytochrome c-type biogenesis protein CcmE
MKPRHKRLAIAGGVVVALGAIAALVLNAFQSNLVFFYSRRRSPRTRRRPIAPSAKTVPVQYEGILPDLFKEGKGVVAQGQLKDGVFVAREVLAKHDENYMPPEAAEALKHGQQVNAKVGKTVVVQESGK